MPPPLRLDPWILYPPSGIRDSRYEGLEELTDAAVREVALQFGGARAQAAKARGFCVLAPRPEQARLAQSRRGFDENDLAAPLPRLVQGIAEFRELEIAFQKGRQARMLHVRGRPGAVGS